MKENVFIMKVTLKICSLFLCIVLFTGCKNKKTLQTYLVETQEKTGFVTVDIPTSFLQLKSNNVSDQVKETLKSIHKINVVALPIKGNEAQYEEEKKIIKNIFKDNDEYRSLVNMKMNGIHLSLFYSGKTSSIDEVIVFGYSTNKGVGIARLLGDHIDPTKIVELLNNIKIDNNHLNLKQLSAIFTRK